MKVAQFLRKHDISLLELVRLTNIPYTTIRYRRDNPLFERHKLFENELESLSGKIERGVIEPVHRTYKFFYSSRPEVIVGYKKKGRKEPFIGFKLVDGRPNGAARVMKHRLKKKFGYVITLYYKQPCKPGAEIWTDKNEKIKVTIPLEVINQLK